MSKAFIIAMNSLLVITGLTVTLINCNAKTRVEEEPTCYEWAEKRDGNSHARFVQYFEACARERNMGRTKKVEDLDGTTK